MTDELYVILTKPKRIDAELKEYRLQVEELEARLLPGAIRYDKDKVQSTPEDQAPAILDKIELLRRKYNAQLDEYGKAVEDIEELLAVLPDPWDRLLIRTKYLKWWMTWEEVMDNIPYGRSTAFERRRKSMQALEEAIHKTSD